MKYVRLSVARGWILDDVRDTEWTGLKIYSKRASEDNPFDNPPA